MREQVDRLQQIVLSIKGGGSIPIALEREGKLYDVLDPTRRIKLAPSEAEPMILVVS